jgi:CHAD domain-containing protein
MVQTIEEKLVKAIQKQAEKVNYYCSAEKVLPDLAIHEIRKSFKRIRALLKFSPNYHQKDVENLVTEIKKLGKVLAPSRESNVNIQILERLSEEIQSVQSDKLTELKMLFAEEHKVILEDALKDRKVFMEIQVLVYDIERKILDWILHIEQQIDVREQICLNYEKAFNLFKQIKKADQDSELHDLRKHLKVLMYQIEFVRNDQPRFFKLKYNELRKLTERLGESHDCSVFLNDLKQNDFDIGTTELVLLEKQILTQFDLKNQKMIKRIQKFFSDFPEVFKDMVYKNYRNQN